MVPRIDLSSKDQVDTVDMVPSYFLPISLGLSTSREHLFKHSSKAQDTNTPTYCLSLSSPGTVLKDVISTKGTCSVPSGASVLTEAH